jgi:hypothetical protein
MKEINAAGDQMEEIYRYRTDVKLKIFKCEHDILKNRPDP